MNALRRLVDPRSIGSLAVRFRQRRFRLFEELVAAVPRPLRILDVGGEEVFWKRMNFLDRPGVHIVVLNQSPPPSVAPSVETVSGDARDLSGFRDSEFDVVFSNSVIEHVGDFSDQRRMADEVRRVAQRYFVQTPNRYFPIEPHFLFPLFQFLPRELQILLVQRFSVGWTGSRLPDREKAASRVDSIRLLGRRQVQELFPGARLYRERVLGLTKSFIAYGGW